MRAFQLIVFAAAMLAGTALSRGQEVPEMPKPEKEHAWLQQLVGQWESDVQLFVAGEGQPPITSKGSEKVRAVGGFWVVAEQQGAFMGQPFAGVLTLGYDAPTQQYVGTWIDSATGHLWTYEGSRDKSGNVLTLESTGPCPIEPGKEFRFKEVLEVKDKDHKIFTSAMQGDDGKWTTTMKIDYRRVSAAPETQNPKTK